MASAWCRRPLLGLVWCALAACAVGVGDYYAILDVQKTATKAEVKSAYRKAALKWHPDKNRGDELAAQKFRDVAQAYEVLSDDDRRKQYDRGGAAGPGGFPGGGFAGGFPGFAGRSADDIFKDVFGDGDPFADFGKIFEGAGDGAAAGFGGGPFADFFKAGTGSFGGAFGGAGPGGFGGGASFSFSSTTTTTVGGKTVTKKVSSTTGSDGKTARRASLEERVGGKTTRRADADDAGGRRIRDTL